MVKRVPGVLCLLVGVVLAAVPGSAGEKELTGQQAYKAYCKPCHTADSPNGEYTPMTLIAEQWERFFRTKYEPTHAALVDSHHDNKKVSEVITPALLEKIRKFAVDHAADSEHPMTCGN